MDILFKEARLKIERAKKHINDLNRLFGDFVNDNTYLVFIDHDPNGGDDLLKVKGTKNLTDSFVLVLGDALHNLRTALDYAINEIEFIIGNKRTKYTKFPIHDTKDGLVVAINGGLKKKVPEQVIDCIVDIIQPYKRGNGDAIWCLDELDIEDKHRLLIASTELRFVSGISIEDDKGLYLVDDWLVVPGKIASHPIRGAKNPKVKDQGKATYRVLFGQESSFGTADIILTLHRLTLVVALALDELERAFRLSQI
ncbi:hypothetical protein [Terracidiphilus gabretensis]|uniref:hypothetical protein n=1 Tax=Terracidiphilus gabretensis TaxID=1577687 RepID=UPI00071B4A04|nr:hypothetical protein [Terracidiphilus gabretensis]